MFTSFLIPSVFEGVRARHLCVFYKQLEAFGRKQVSFVGEPAYFEAPSALEASGRPEWHQSWKDAYGYEPPANLTGVACQALPTDLFARRLQRLGSSWALYRQLLTRRLPELEAAFTAAFDALHRETPVHAVLAFANNPSVSHVAQRRGVPVVHNEFGPLRSPDYVMTGYWDRHGVSRGTEAARRYAGFQRASRGARPPLLSREELLQVLRRAPLAETPTSAHASVRVGIALQGEDNACVQGIGALDLISMARQRYRPDEILVRYHSGSVARYPESYGVPDASPTATAFIQRCQSVLTVSSGTALEALLLGRRAVVVGDSPFALAADRRFEPLTRRSATAQLRALNFLVFGYLVPGELMFNAAYVTWRLSAPCEVEIYRRHQRWYRDQLIQGPRPDVPDTALAAGAKLLDAVPTGEAPVPLVIFGAGASTPALTARLRPERFTVHGVFDNDEGKWGARVGDLSIARPAFRARTSVVVSSMTHADAMVAQLLGLGYPADRILRVR